jgi:two-component system response regulator RegA
MPTVAVSGGRATSGLGVRSVLIVDDDERVTASMARALGTNRTVEVAHDGETALELARRSRPDLVIVDLRLGNQSGIDAIRSIKSELPDSVIALVSGYVSTDVTVMAVKAGADHVLAKPISGQDLLRRVAVGQREELLAETPSLAQVEAEHIARVLSDCRGNVSEAARRLGIYRSSLQRKLRKAKATS